MVFGSIACSTARNGPTSLPDGLIVPTTAAATSQSHWSVSAKITPAPAISAAPATCTRRRPTRSATAVRTMVMPAPPTSDAVKIPPMAAELNPRAAREGPSITERKP